jgi:hypothetical protein
LPPVAAWLCGVAHGRGCGGNAPWKYFYSVLVYLSCVPGTFAAVITAYTFFFTRENLMDVNPLVYFLPLVSMVATLVLIHKNVAFDLVPGFDRLEGLMVMIACSFVFALAIQKTKIWVVFGGSIGGLFLLAAGVFALLKWGVYMLFRRRDEPKQAPPSFPNA